MQASIIEALVFFKRGVGGGVRRQQSGTHWFDVAQARRQQSSVGIFGMSERAELLGGVLDIESSPAGTTVYVELPV